MLTYRTARTYTPDRLAHRKENKPVPKNIDTKPETECPACHGRGIAYNSLSSRDDNVYPETCEECNGTGRREIPRDSCEACGSDELRFVSITSREPYGQTFTDEGWRCAKCGVVSMRPVAPPIQSNDLIGD